MTSPTTFHKTSASPERRTQPLLVLAVHLDLKGLPPTPKRLVELPRIFAAAGYNAVLVEWENAFPWTIKEFRSPTAYEPDIIREFAAQCRHYQLDIIPLVQTLGHMESFLTPASFAHLREVPERSDVISPLADGAQPLILGLIDDVLKLIPEVRYFHLGGDEAWTFGKGQASQAFIEKHSKSELYLHHMTPLLNHLNRQAIRPILWHDMMVHWPDEDLRRLKDVTDLMAWGYGDPPDCSKTHYHTRYIQRFHDLGITLWGGTAYKGADGNTADLPNLKRREINASAWYHVAKRFEFKGLAATAWSRYSTHRPQNEPIDAALDSLFYIGQILRTGSVPEGGRQAAMDLLRGINEEQTFLKCHKALAEFSEIRWILWENIKYAWEQRALERTRRDYRHSHVFAMTLEAMNCHAQELHTASEQVKKALDGLVDPIWIDEYLAPRLEAIQEQIKVLDSLQG